MIENLTTTIQSSQQKEFEILNSPNFSLKHITIPFPPNIAPNSQSYQLPSSKLLGPNSSLTFFSKTLENLL